MKQKNFEEYKSELNAILKNKKKKLEEAYKFDKEKCEEKLKNKKDEELNDIIQKEKETLEKEMEGTAHLKNIIYHDSGPYIISSATFPSYFQKDEKDVIESHANLDLEIFVKIAKALNINVR